MAVIALLIAAIVACSALAERADGEDFAKITKHGVSEAALAEDVSAGCENIPQCATDESKPIFFDMVHSNNAARVRLFIRLYVSSEVPICMVTYADMRCDWFKRINPNQKVPAIVIPTDSKKEVLFESNVIFEYMVDAYRIPQPPSVPFQHRDLYSIHRAKVNLMCRVHDLYVASPNCNQPGCTHSQGALYLPPPGKFDNTGGRRAVDITTRSLKIKELWTRWTWLEDFSSGLGTNTFLAGEFLSMADMTWFPTAVFMEFLLTHVAGWPVLFADYDASAAVTRDLEASRSVYGDWVAAEKWNPGPVDPLMQARLPKLTAWYPRLLQIPEFGKVREEIMGFWLNERHLDALETPKKDRMNRFVPIKDAIRDAPKDLAWRPVQMEGGTLDWPGN